VTEDLEYIAINMVAAVICGALIGTERQLRHRMAGVRTNALVALGAASFVIFASLFPGDGSPTRVPAQIVSGIGFLGAGIIFRDGLNVHGLNTAATLWCAAGVGMMCGAGALDIALLLTGILLAINIGLRPLVNWLDSHLIAGLRPHRLYRLELTGSPLNEATLRMALLHKLKLVGLPLTGIDTELSEDGLSIKLAATVGGEDATDERLEKAVALLAAEPGLERAHWQRLSET
jgi:putative Mg2+ transporter-C (MgtC) family protein